MDRVAGQFAKPPHRGGRTVLVTLSVCLMGGTFGPQGQFVECGLCGLLTPVQYPAGSLHQPELCGVCESVVEAGASD